MDGVSKRIYGDHIKEKLKSNSHREVQEETGIIGQIYSRLHLSRTFTKWMDKRKKLCIIFSWSMQVEIQKIS